MGLKDVLATYTDEDGARPAKLPRTEVKDVVMATLGAEKLTDMLDMPTELILKLYYDHFHEDERLSVEAINFIAFLDVLNASVPVAQMSYNLARALDMLFERELRPGEDADLGGLHSYYSAFVMLNWNKTCRKSAFVYATPEDESEAIDQAVRAIATSGKHMTQRWAWFTRTFPVPPRTPDDIVTAIQRYSWPFVKMVTSMYPVTKQELLEGSSKYIFRGFASVRTWRRNPSAPTKRMKWMLTHYGITKDDFIRYWFERFNAAGQPHALRAGFPDELMFRHWNEIMDSVLKIYPVFSKADLDRMLPHADQMGWIRHQVKRGNEPAWIIEHVEDVDTSAILGELTSDEISSLVNAGEPFFVGVLQDWFISHYDGSDSMSKMLIQTQNKCMEADEMNELSHELYKLHAGEGSALEQGHQSIMAKKKTYALNIWERGVKIETVAGIRTHIQMRHAIRARFPHVNREALWEFVTEYEWRARIGLKPDDRLEVGPTTSVTMHIEGTQ